MAIRIGLYCIAGPPRYFYGGWWVAAARFDDGLRTVFLTESEVDEWRKKSSSAFAT